MISEIKYNKIMLDDFKSNKNQLQSEFLRVIEEYGYSEQVKVDFYKGVFTAMMKYHIRYTAKDENYESTIINFYNIFINALKEDNVETDDIEIDLEDFKKNKLSYLKSDFIPENRVYNLNTKYGRKKAREQSMRNYQNGNSEYRNEQDIIKFWAMVVLIIGVILFYWLKSTLKV